MDESTYDNVQTEDIEIVDDIDFLDHVKEAKKLLDIGDINKLKQQQAELLRVELSKIIKYVMDKVQSEREAEQQEQQQQEQETAPVPESQLPMPEYQPQQQPQQPQPAFGGYKKKSKANGKTKRVKGGAISTPISGTMDGNRILNTGGLTNANHDPQKVAGSSETVIAGSLHRAFSAGNQAGISSTQGLTLDTMKTLLPFYGTGGSLSSKSKKKEKAQKK